MKSQMLMTISAAALSAVILSRFAGAAADLPAFAALLKDRTRKRARRHRKR